jgi:alkanesulfonate monooxygenase SsuD/methylene tetrahydromethanopterin reductase-like flavin-dependent oxidoreductase (luciferase family)
VRFGAAFWIQRTDWPDLRDAALAAEQAGFDSLWLDDHLLSDEGDWRDAKLEGWLALTALAPLTHVRLGHLVVANTFRNPGLTAKMAATLDNISGGRFVLGLGGGWFGREHEAFGLDFGSGFGERLDRLEEATDIIERLLAGEHVTYHGRFYDIEDAICEPRPVQPRSRSSSAAPAARRRSGPPHGTRISGTVTASPRGSRRRLTSCASAARRSGATTWRSSAR